LSKGSGRGGLKLEEKVALFGDFGTKKRGVGVALARSPPLPTPLIYATDQR